MACSLCSTLVHSTSHGIFGPFPAPGHDELTLTFSQWAYIIYIVVKRRFFPSSVQALRESMARALNRGDTAYKFSELIDKHGSEKWLGPLADRLGPHVQLQMNDLANMLEVFSK